MPSDFRSARTCLHCYHCKVGYEGPWSDVTPGEGLTFLCRIQDETGRLLFYHDEPGMDLQRLLIQEIGRAETCPHFEREGGHGAE